jgi:lipoprotein-anchoring transpeptidase ErfK/SrfK
MTFSPAKGASGVRPDEQVRVSVDRGTLTSVLVRSANGSQVSGELDSTGGTWNATAPLAAGASYAVTAQAQTPDGVAHTVTSDFTTLKPASTMSAVLIPGDDWVVGVGMPVIVQFGRTVKNKDAAVKTLKVSATPQVDGAWHWMNDESVWWRPRDFWPAGTTVRLTAALDGAELAPGVWGRRTYTARFAIGSSIISTVDLKKHTMTIMKDGALARVLPVTAGKDDPRFRTRSGTKVIMEKLQSVRMDATTTGTDPKDPEFYNTVEYWAMRLTWSGEYLHARPGSDWAFGTVNISHGCTGLSNANAKWLFDFSKIGDVVKYTGSSRQLEFGNGYTAWDMPYEQWAGEPSSPAVSSPSVSAPSPAGPASSGSLSPAATAGSSPHGGIRGPGAL